VQETAEKTTALYETKKPILKIPKIHRVVKPSSHFFHFPGNRIIRLYRQPFTQLSPEIVPF